MDTVQVIANEKNFGARAPAIFDSGAGSHVCDEDDVPDHDVKDTKHRGFKNASGGAIPARGEAEVAFMDHQIGKPGTAKFIIGPVKRPLFSTGMICDKGHIALYSSKGAFVVDEAVARPIVQSLVKHAKLSFKRDQSTNGLYELEGSLTTPFHRQVTK